MTPRPIFSAATALLLAAAILPTGVRAENDGQEDLDRATEAKLTAKNLGDLDKVISLTESALKKGLGKENKTFAENLLVSTLCQRGTMMAAVIFKTFPPDARWPQFRNVALSDLEKAVKLNDNLPEAHYFIARLNLLPGGDRKKAADALNKTVKLAEDDKMKADALVLKQAKPNRVSCAEVAETHKHTPTGRLEAKPFEDCSRCRVA